MAPDGARRGGGFTLIEVVVALAITVLAGGVLLQIFAQGLQGAERTRRVVQATTLAESLLAGLGADQPIAAQDRAGETDGGFRWRLKVEPTGDPDEALLPLALYRAEVQVEWGAQPYRRSISLETLKLGAKG